MHKKFEINRTKIKGGCQSGRKVVTNNSNSDLPLSNFADEFEFLTPDWPNFIFHQSLKLALLMFMLLTKAKLPLTYPTFKRQFLFPYSNKNVGKYFFKKIIITKLENVSQHCDRQKICISSKLDTSELLKLALSKWS